MIPSNLLLTGVPRSGTSLFTSLLSAEHCLCFSEPPWLKTLKQNCDNSIILTKHLKLQIDKLRENIKNGLPIDMVYKVGTRDLPDNYFEVNHSSIKKLREVRETIYPKHYAHNTFIVKANALFTANLKDLHNSPHWKVFAIVRDPVATLMSWRTVTIAASSGRVKSVEKYSNELQTIGVKKPLLKRQVLLLDWYFKQYQMLPNQQLISYENLIKNPSYYIKNTTGHEPNQSIQLNTQNNNPNYNHDEKDKIIAALAKYGQHFKKHYPQYK